MCNDYGNRIPYRDYAEAFSQIRLPLVFPKPDAAPNLEPRDEIWPTDTAPVIRPTTGGSAMLAQTVPVNEAFRGEAVCEGVVHIFDLKGHPQATRAYAWSSPIEGSERRRFFAVLQLGAIKSPVDAVRAAIVAEHRASS